jgi:hypothetical protein
MRELRCTALREYYSEHAPPLVGRERDVLTRFEGRGKLLRKKLFSRYHTAFADPELRPDEQSLDSRVKDAGLFDLATVTKVLGPQPLPRLGFRYSLSVCPQLFALNCLSSMRELSVCPQLFALNSTPTVTPQAQSGAAEQPAYASGLHGEPSVCVPTKSAGGVAAFRLF